MRSTDGGGTRNGADRNGYNRDAFLRAYDKVLAKWPADRTSTQVTTPFGVTYVQVCGPRDAPPLVLLPGGGATSVSWFAQAGELARSHRVYAPDLIGDVGRSAGDAGRDIADAGDEARGAGDAGRGTASGERRIRTVADLTAWLDALLDGLGVTAGPTALGGHSYGAWIALHYALHAPARVNRLFLLDPTQCFAGFRPAYLLHALPMLLRPAPHRVRAFLAWETGGAVLDPDWLALQEAGAGFPAARPVTGPRPAAEALRGLDVPVLLLLAGNSRTHDPSRVAARAGAVLPRARTVVLPGVSHHALPHAAPPELGRRIGEFLGGPGVSAGPGESHDPTG
ncbi:alpha/beta fold hydrolase [Streptomyces sp. NPDC056716]|uniref:alpha/beta fold hydrolase n=1 Tax=unclassified Streptomyces TaxID=2593676 RepID=UPI0036A0F22E